QAGRIVRVRLVLQDACRGIGCPAGQRCEDGNCIDEEMPPPPEPGPGPDGGGLDGGPPMPVTCAANADCDDHFACNGAETCSDVGVCTPGVVLDCSDGIDCTEDGCGPDGECIHTPVNGRCV